MDQFDFRRLYIDPKAEYGCHLFVEGIRCASCVNRLERMPEIYDGVQEARVQIGRSLLSLRVTSDVSLTRIMEILAGWGYEARFLEPKESDTDLIARENRKFLIKIAVAGACAGNIMLFVVPVYAGLEGDLKNIFNWVSFFLFLPILLYSATDFYKGALSGLRSKSINMDLPITIALWAGFLLSTVNLIRGREELYFDSIASFLFLILSSRYLLLRVQQNYLKPLRASELMNVKSVLKKQEAQWTPAPVSSLKTGDVVRIEREQVLPFDGALLSAEALLDLSIMTGESFPQKFAVGMEIVAGTRLKQEYADFRVARPLEESRLSHILSELEEGGLRKTALLSLTDRLAQKLVLVVFFVALAFFAVYSVYDFQEAFNRALALIVLACPCALAFGAPLTYGLALRRGQKLGILIRNPSSLEKILKVKNVFFDKTGTLTQGNLRFAAVLSGAVSEEHRSIILSLERKSFHPVAFALREAWSGVPLLDVTDLTETLGKGVSGVIDGERYSVSFLSESMHENYLGVVLLKGSEALCRIYFEDPVRHESSEIVNELKGEGVECFILSGDRRQRVLEVGRQCGIDSARIFPELFPEDKRDILQKHQNTCMIGDGVNDAPSLAAADVGIVLKGGLPLSLKGADVYFLKSGLRLLSDLRGLAVRTRRVLYRNLTLSLAYNALGGIAALLGWINPLWAAVLMPLSSTLIVLSTLWGLR